ncbi:MAG TPA: NADH-quinone oxidoreductase subunit D, partial [Gaiellaceae bacterium]
MAVAPTERRAPIYEGTRIPSPIPTVLKVPADLAELDDLMQVNFGPNHPSTHGVLRLIVDLYGERVVGLEAVIGYLHTGFEKNMEQKTWWKGITYAPRMDYLAFQANEYAYVAAVEKLLALEVPEKAVWMRTCLLELNRIHSHLVWIGTSALELGAISMFWYAFRERDTILDLFEMVTGVRMHTRYFQVGGLAEDLPSGFLPECRKFVDWMPKAVDDYEALLTGNEIWIERTRGIGVLSAADAVALGQSGPVLRASGVNWDIRRAEPYLAYPQIDFDVPVYEHGDVYDRYLVHVDE